MDNLKEKRQELKRLLQERAEQVLGKSISPQILERIVLTTPSYTDVQPSADTATPSTSDTGSSNNSSTDNKSTNSSMDNAPIDSSGTRVSTEGSTLGTLAARKLQLENESASLQSQLASLRREKAQADFANFYRTTTPGRVKI